MTRKTSSSKSIPPRRPRGAPAGNLNALKHGFYSRQFRKADLGDLDDIQFTGLLDEIKLLRVFIRRVVEMGYGAADLPTLVSLLRVVCLASATLNRLIKTQHLLASGTDDVTITLLQALEEFAATDYLDVKANTHPVFVETGQPPAGKARTARH